MNFLHFSVVIDTYRYPRASFGGHILHISPLPMARAASRIIYSLLLSLNAGSPVDQVWSHSWPLIGDNCLGRQFIHMTWNLCFKVVQYCTIFASYKPNFTKLVFQQMYMLGKYSSTSPFFPVESCCNSYRRNDLFFGANVRERELTAWKTGWWFGTFFIFPFSWE